VCTPTPKLGKVTWQMITFGVVTTQRVRNCYTEITTSRIAVLLFHDRLKSCDTLDATSFSERLSTSTCLSTPRSNRANTRAGVPFASRIMMGKSGLCCFSTGYVDAMNCLVPADAAPVWQQRMRTSRRAGDKTLAKDIAEQGYVEVVAASRTQHRHYRVACYGDVTSRCIDQTEHDRHSMSRRSHVVAPVELEVAPSLHAPPAAPTRLCSGLCCASPWILPILLDNYAQTVDFPEPPS